MATTFKVFNLGIIADLDTSEGSALAENANAIVGATYGSNGDPLYDHIQTFAPGSTGFSGGATTAYDTDQNVSAETFTIDGGIEQFFDSAVHYNVTITYIDGTSASLSSIVFQDSAGNAYLAPEVTDNAEQALLEAKPIASVTIDSIINNANNMTADRVDSDFMVPDGTVDGTAGNDVMSVGFVDAQGDTIDGADGNTDVIYGYGGNDSIDGGASADIVYGGAGSDTVDGGDGNDFILGDMGPSDVKVSQSGTITQGNYSDTSSGYTVTAQNVVGGVLGAASTSNIGVYAGGGFGANGGISHSDSLVSEQTGYDLASGTSENITIAFDDDIQDLSFSFSVLFTSTFGEEAHYTLYLDGALVSESDFTETTSGSGSGTINITGVTFDTIVFTGLPQTDGTDGSDFLINSVDYTTVPLDPVAGDDELYGGAGTDTINGQDGNDTLYGGDDADLIMDSAGNDTAYGGEGKDRFDYTTITGNDTVVGGEVNDTTPTDSGDKLDAHNSTDNLTVTFTGDEAGTMTDGTDTVTFSEIEHIMGGQGTDTIDASASSVGQILDGGENADTITGSSGDDIIALGQTQDFSTTDGDDDTLILFDGFGDDSIEGFEVPDDLGGGSYSGNDQLDVTSLTDTGGNPVDTNDVTVTDTNADGTGDAILTFPNGESITLWGVTTSQVSSPAQLEAIGIPLAAPSSTVIKDAIELSGNAPAASDVLTTAAGDLVEIDEPLTFTTASSSNIATGDTVTIDGTLYTVTSITGVEGNFTHSDGAGGSTITPVKSYGLNLDDGSGGTLSYIIPVDAMGALPEITQIEVLTNDPTTNIDVLDVDADDNVTLSAVCFAKGTHIETQNGLVLIENLNEGDKIKTRDNGMQKIRWVGSSIVRAKKHLAPILIKAGALNNHSDLRVSPQHRMLIDGLKSEILFGEREVLAAAKHLVNDTNIFVEKTEKVEYFHILFDAHEVIFAEGAPSESFHPGEEGMTALDQASQNEIYEIFPELQHDYNSFGPSVHRSLKMHEAVLLA